MPYGQYGQGFRLRRPGLYKAGAVLSGVGDFFANLENYKEQRKQQYLQELIASNLLPVREGLPTPQGHEDAPGVQGKHGFRIARPQQFDLSAYLKSNLDQFVSSVSVDPSGKKSYQFKTREKEKPRTPGTPQEEFELFRGAQQQLGVPEEMALRAAEESPYGFPSEVKAFRLAQKPKWKDATPEEQDIYSYIADEKKKGRLLSFNQAKTELIRQRAGGKAVSAASKMSQAKNLLSTLPRKSQMEKDPKTGKPTGAFIDLPFAQTKADSLKIAQADSLMNQALDEMLHQGKNENGNWVDSLPPDQQEEALRLLRELGL